MILIFFVHPCVAAWTPSRPEGFFLSVFQAQLQRSLDNSVSAQARPLIGRRIRKEAPRDGRRPAASGQDPGSLDVEDEEDDEVRNLQSQISQQQSYCSAFRFTYLR